jgi:acetyl-CoA acetyltransferase
VTNPSGGIPAEGHPLGATGVAQCAEPVGQLRGQAGARQADYANPPTGTPSGSAARRWW